MQYLLSLRTWWRAHVKQAPLDWWMGLNRKPLVIGFLVAALVGCGQFINFLMDVRTRGLFYLSLGVVSISLIAALVIAKCSLPRLTEMVIIVCAFLMIVSMQFASVLISDDLAYRTRSHAIAMAVWKPFPAIFGFPILSAVVFIGATVVMDIGSLFLCQVYHQDPFQPRMAGTSAVYALAGIGAAFMQMGRLCGIYDIQQALSTEKALMESIIAMMCDAIVWLSEDGSTVLRSDPRFAMLVGRSAVGEQVVRSLPEEEHTRLQDCLSRAKEAPVLLPTTLMSDSGAKIPVDIFVVGNRNVSEAKKLQDKTPAFLIGIRIASRQGTEELRDVGMKQEHASMLVQSQPDGEEHKAPEDELHSTDHLSSIPETTATSRIFSQVDVDRWLQGTPEDRVAEMRSGLQKVDALGQSEHWLISERDLKLQPNEVLGTGAFGAVLGGWLHGSPVAVKVAKRRKDSPVKHLVSITNEIRIFRHLRHPNVALWHGACVEPLEGEVLLVLERVKGPDLCSYVMKHSGDAQVYSRFQLLLDVAVAVRYLHSQSPQIIHGDLKGSNVLVEAAVPRAKLVDFGLSRLLTRDAKPLGGSLPWMAPELIIRPSTLPRSSADVFSFGRLAYMILACRKPLEGLSPAAIREMARAGLTHNLVWDEGRPLQRECAALCKRMLSLAPEQRPDMRRVHQEASAWVLPDLEEKMPTVELARAAQGTGGSLASLAATMHSFREALAAKPQQAQQPDRQCGGGAGQAANALVASQGGPVVDPPPMAGGVERQVPTPARAEAAQGERPEPSPPMALPALMETQISSKSFMLLDALRQWNYPSPPDSCCKYHAAIAELRRMSLLLTTTSCRPDFAPYREFQCRTCGMLDFEVHPACPICNTSATRAPSLASIREEVPEPVDGSPSTIAL